jgi:hypothetical protein
MMRDKQTNNSQQESLLGGKRKEREHERQRNERARR